METAENLCLDFGCWGKDFFAKVSYCFTRFYIMPSEKSRYTFPMYRLSLSA